MKYIYTIILIIIFSAISTFAQKSNGSIEGTLYDSAQGEPVDFANIILFDQSDSSQVSGTTTNEKGLFTLLKVKPGRYFLEARFIGYANKSIDDIIISPSNSSINLGNIPMEQTVIQVEGVAIEAERAAITYDIDRKVIDVSKMQTAVSGSAVEVLENVPSVTVDIEGNVALRGSSNFTLLINGRPTVLDANDALQQTPASSIDKIEVISNPSSKYDPDGTSGIINLQLKKNQDLGRSALINLNGGVNNKYGGDILYQHKTKNINYLMGVDFNRRIYEGGAREEKHTIIDSHTSFVDSKGDGERGRNSQGFRGAIEWNANETNTLMFDGRFGNGRFFSNSNRDYNEWTTLDPNRTGYFSVDERERGGNRYGLNMIWLHRFAKKGHEVTGQINYSRNDGEEFTINELRTLELVKSEGLRSDETGPSTDVRLKLDYTRPFANESKFEAGFQSNLDNSTDNTSLSEYDPAAGQYIVLPAYTRSTTYERSTHAIYAIYGVSLGKFGIQSGLRGEYTDRVVELAGENQKASINRWDLFPTLHASYKLGGSKQLMASYARRIERPRGYYLEPFETWMDAYNVRTGNPALKPEYIDSYEAGYSMPIGSTMFSTEAYYRISNNKIERIRSVYDTNVTLQSVENVGTDYALGVEFMIDSDFHERWNVGLTGNFYDYRIKGVLYDRPFSRQSYNWNTRLNNTFKFTKTLQLQLTGRYISPTVSSQGRREGFFMTDLALKKDFFGRFLSTTLQVRDIFGQARWEYTSAGVDYYSYSRFTRESPIVMLNVRMNLNNFKQKSRGQTGGGDGMDGGMGGEF